MSDAPLSLAHDTTVITPEVALTSALGLAFAHLSRNAWDALVARPPEGIAIRRVRADGDAVEVAVLVSLRRPPATIRLADHSMTFEAPSENLVALGAWVPQDDSQAEAAMALLLRVGHDREAPGVGRLARYLPSLPTRDVIRLTPKLAYVASAADTARATWFAVGASRIAPMTTQARSLDPAVGSFLFAPITERGQLLIAEQNGVLRTVELDRGAKEGSPAFIDHLEGHSERVGTRIKDAMGAHVASAEDPALARAFSLVQLRTSSAPRGYRSVFEGLHVDLELAVPVAGKGVFIAGVLQDKHAFIERVTLISPYGEALDASPHLQRLNAGGGLERFVAFVPLARGCPPVGQWRAQVLLAGQVPVDVVAPVFSGSMRNARDAILRSVPDDQYQPALIEAALAPALGPVQQACVQDKSIDVQRVFGTPPVEPRVSIVVPLYNEYGFIRHQLHALAFDSDVETLELIYVLDQPSDRARVEHLLEGLYLTYGVPVRLLVASENYGYAGATNLGAECANGRHLLLMNSDVVPCSTGWLGRWVARHEATPQVGISGPRLLYADGSLQHAGMLFEGGLMPWWTNNHYFKGYAGSYRPACISREVPAVTGACALIDRALFFGVGGLSEDYVIGDFEDSDLTLKVRQAGFNAWYFAEEALFHFERVSIRNHAGYARTPAVRYNGWLHSKRWGMAIERLMDDLAPADKAVRRALQ